MSVHPTAATAATANGRAERASEAMSVRLAALVGVVFFILIIINARLRTGAPAATDPAREVLRFFARHHDRL
jgi:hypothetical protein